MRQIVFFIQILVLFSCIPEGNETLTVAVASSLRPVFLEIKQQFKLETNIDINLISASSGKLTAQVEAGAPYDVFLSADQSYLHYLKSRLSLAEDPFFLGFGRLIFLTSNDIDLGATSIKMVINSNQLQKIAIPNPKLAPYGKAAYEALVSLEIEPIIRDQLVYGESVSQSNQFLKSKVVNAGFTSLSSIQMERLSEGYQIHHIPNKLYQPIANHGIVLTENKKTISDKFLAFLKTSQVSMILNKYGYYTSK